MAKVDGSLVSLVQGVSQQPNSKRLDGQCTLQENMSSDPVRNLTRRIPSTYLGELGGVAAKQFITIEGEDRTPEFLGVIRPPNLNIYSLDGVLQTTTILDGAGTHVLQSAGKVVQTSIDGVTYLQNTSKTVAMTGTQADFFEHVAIVYVMGGLFSRTYKVTVDGTTVSHTTPDGTDPSHSAQISTDYIAGQLRTAIDGLAGYTATIKGDVVSVTKQNLAAIQVTVDDGDGGTNLRAITNVIDRPENLPRYAPNKYHVRVVGDGNSLDDDWYLEYDIDGITTFGGFGTLGVWREATGNGVETELDPTTMPYALVQTGPSSFTLSAADWEDRRVGDDNTNPKPTVVGTTIQDLGSFQGRLVLLTPDTLVMSRTNRLRDLWKSTATDTVASDPIDILSTSTNTTLRHLVPHNRDLLIFADQAQFLVFGRTALTPDNASLVLTTSTEASPVAKPTPAGRNVFFSVDAGLVSRVKEYFSAGDADINDSRDITSHVSEYIEGTVTKFTSSDNLNTLIVHTDKDPRVLYVYEYIWADSQKIQASWSTWTFKNDVVHSFFRNAKLYLVVFDGVTYHMETIDYGLLRENPESIPVMLDSATEVSGVSLSVALPYEAKPEEDMVVVQGPGCPNPGLTAEIDFTAGATVQLREDMMGGTVTVGLRYLSRYKPSIPTVKDSKGVPISTGSLTLADYILSYEDTGNLKVAIESEFRATREVEFEGRVFNTPGNLIGEPSVETGKMLVPIMDDTNYVDITVMTDSHLPMTLLDIEWRGQFNKYGSRS